MMCQVSAEILSDRKIPRERSEAALGEESMSRSVSGSQCTPKLRRERMSGCLASTIWPLLVILLKPRFKLFNGLMCGLFSI